jgi:hypothetical protein
LFDWFVAECKRLHVKFIYLHNAMRGRGRTLGRFFEKRGAVHMSNTYALRLFPPVTYDSNYRWRSDDQEG